MGEVFAGRYELADPIGRGGVGAVWRAWDHRRRRYVAAKVLQQSDAHALLRFVREQALRIDHPHVLAPASWAADDDKVLFTMDLVGGGSLVHLVGDYGPLPPGFVCTLLDQLLSGLTAVHAEGVVHRDIKPANILLEATGTARPRLRLSDFGIAMRLGEPRLTETNLVVGTPGYLAPEQMMGADPDFPADLFAVGLVALYLLEGAKPDAKALIQYFAEHGTPGAPKSVPEPLWQVVATLLQPDPQARFRTATGARKALAAAVELLPEPGPDDEMIEIFDQLGPLPKGFGADGPSAPRPRTGGGTGTGTGSVPTRPNTPPAPAHPGTGSLPSRPHPAPDPASAGSGSFPSGSYPSGPGRAAGPAHPGTGGRPSRTDGTSTPSVAASHSGAGSVPGSGSVRLPPAPLHAPDSAPTPTPAPAPAPAHVPSMSDTGSFHLPPPQSPTPYPPASAAPAYESPYESPEPHTPHAPQAPQAPHESTFVLPSRGPRAEVSTASYTAQDPQVPQPAAQAVAPRGGRRGHRAARRGRPGPPAKVAVPLLLLALVCYAVGFWALARV
ncbi:serine/threonine-protein kinase [Streptomyces soliscabiei]|uniref:serine/threonine-protein kinase n=1 Tax=Streptomyces soliscabiei TaxID=588897 RepID=UPI0029BFA66F|nr:protein kinase [Streptomyces sp. NY05-11A]MDX2677181.1 protein kinase [Streptomyces sp. NY05-11A]